MAQWDLTSKLGRYLDRHLIFPLLEFLSQQEMYDGRKVQLAKLNLLRNTNMVDFAIDVHKQLHNSDSEELATKREDVLARLKQLNSQTQEILDIILEENVRKEIEGSRDTKVLLEKLEKDFGVKPEMIESIYNFAKFQYECGNYSGASQFLSSYVVLILPSDKNYLDALWGKFGSEILMQNWNQALKDLQRLKDYLDNNSFSNHLIAAQQRTWLIHWSLFVFFNHVEGREMLIEMFLEKKSSYYNPKHQHQPYLNAIQTMCPHILRYLTAAVITSRQRRAYMKELVKVIQQESYTYRDPITEFVECLYVNFDFDGAQQKLRECETVLKHDFFLVACLDDFIDNARLFIFETFCQIHECISIEKLADKLNMNPEEAERWIVNLIRNARLDAKIDSKLGHVVMGAQAVSPYQQLIEKTKAMTIRCHILSVNIEKKLVATAAENENTFGTVRFPNY